LGASTLTGIALTLGAVAFFATLDTATKLALGAVPVLMALWFRYFFQAVVTTAVMVPRRGWSIWRTRRPGLQVLRGLLLVSSSVVAFQALLHMPVAEFTAIVSLVPLLITVLTAWFFQERVSPLRWLLVVGGFSGAMIIIRPGAEQFSLAFLLPFVVLVANSLFQLLTSRMVRTEDPLTMQLYTGAALGLGRSQPAVLGLDGPDGPVSGSGPFPAHPGLRTHPGGHDGALSVRADRLCRVGRLAGVLPCARCLVTAGHVRDCPVWHHRRLADDEAGAACASGPGGRGALTPHGATV
jgi:drug/metabolite transporter (DMT)-like permease